MNVLLTPTILPAKHSAVPHVHHEIGCEHSARRRGPIHCVRILTNLMRAYSLSNAHFHITKYVFPHYRIRVSDSSNACIRFTKSTYSHYRICAFVLPRTHLCITIPIYSFFVIYNIEYKTPLYGIYIYVNCINCFLGYFLIKIQNCALHPTLYICMHPNFVLTSGRNCVPIILPIPSVEPRFISPLYRFHTQNGGWKICAHLISTPRNCTKLCMDRIICSHASHSIRTSHSWNHIAFS